MESSVVLHLWLGGTFFSLVIAVAVLCRIICRCTARVCAELGALNTNLKRLEVLQKMYQLNRAVMKEQRRAARDELEKESHGQEEQTDEYLRSLAKRVCLAIQTLEELVGAQPYDPEAISHAQLVLEQEWKQFCWDVEDFRPGNCPKAEYRTLMERYSRTSRVRPPDGTVLSATVIDEDDTGDFDSVYD